MNPLTKLTINPKWWPTPGNIIFTLLTITTYALTQQTWATSTSGLPAAVPTTFNYQGQLTTSHGLPINDEIDLMFSIFDVPTDGVALWGEAHPNTSVTNGLFQVSLGSVVTIPPNLWQNGELYLQVIANGESLLPREKFHSIPTSQIAGLALTVPDGAITTEKIADGAISSSKLNLNKGETCLTNNVDLAISPTVVDIPGLTTTFTVEQPSTVWASIDGIGHLNSGTSASVYLEIQSSQATYSGAGNFLYNTFYWYPIKGQRLFNLAAGTYTFKARTYTENSSANIKIQGWFHPYRTCITYFILGQ